MIDSWALESAGFSSVFPPWGQVDTSQNIWQNICQARVNNVCVCVFLLRVLELVHQRHLLHQVSSDGANQLVEVVLREGLAALRQPEGDVVVERRVFTEGLATNTWTHSGCKEWRNISNILRRTRQDGDDSEEPQNKHGDNKTIKLQQDNKTKLVFNYCLLW